MIITAKSVSSKILWANMHLLFWLSMIPFVTAWMGENHFEMWPVVFYGFVLLMNAIAYAILAVCLVSHHGKDSLISKAIGNDWKGKLSIIVYAAAIGLTFLNAWIGIGLYSLLAIAWLIPDRRIERVLVEAGESVES